MLFSLNSKICLLVFSVLWKIKFSRKVKFFTWQVLHGHTNMMDRLAWKLLSLVGSFCCILYRKAEKDMDHILGHCDFVRAV